MRCSLSRPAPCAACTRCAWDEPSLRKPRLCPVQTRPSPGHLPLSRVWWHSSKPPVRHGHLHRCLTCWWLRPEGWKPFRGAMPRPQLGHARTLVQHGPVLPRRCPAGPQAWRNDTVSTHWICQRLSALPGSLFNKESADFCTDGRQGHCRSCWQGGFGSCGGPSAHGEKAGLCERFL